MKQQQEKNKATRDSKIESLWAYTIYNFQRFIKKPFGYIVSLLYVVFLATILLIVPKVNNFDPLFIWNIGGFNIPILNLIFVAASAASIAVIVFRTGRDDGSDLVFSSKPLTKGETVAIKTFVYVSIMLLLCILCLIITALVLPIFKEYNLISNPKGITLENYKGLILSVLVGNIISLLFFGAIAAFISMIGKQVIVMITTISISLLMLIINFLIPVISSSPLKILSDNYNSQIQSISCNTLSQYNKNNSPVYNYATIICSTDDEGIENPNTHFDTEKYWKKANQESHQFVSNYLDFGKQLSSLYSAFGLDNAKLEEASKLSIGINNNFKYTIQKDTHVADQFESANYPIAIYTLTQSRGKTFPKMYILGGDMSISGSNWYIISKLLGLDFNSVSFASTEKSGSRPNGIDATVFDFTQNKPWNRMSDLILTDTQIPAADKIYYSAFDLFQTASKQGSVDFSLIVQSAIAQDESNQFFDAGKFIDLPNVEQYQIVAKLHLYFAIKAQQEQITSIKSYFDSISKPATFPFKSNEIIQYINQTAAYDYQENYFKQQFEVAMFNQSVQITPSALSPSPKFDRLLITPIEYAETYSNMYQYTVAQRYSLWLILGVWSALSIGLFASAIVVYRKTDFK